MNHTSALNQPAIADIQSLINAGRFKVALMQAKNLVAAQPQCAEHWLMLSEVLAHPKVAANPIAAIRTAVKLEPNNPHYLAQLANCLLISGNFSEAQHIAEQVSQQPELNAFTLDKLGNVLNGCGELHGAYACFSRAVKQSPEDAHFLFNLATLQRAMGQLDDAEQSFSRVIAMRPDDSSAYLARSSLRKMTSINNYVPELQVSLNKKNLHPASQIRLCYALAKELEDIGDYPRSFQFLQQGSALRRKRMHYHVADDVDAMAKIRECFTEDTYRSIATGTATTEPIFILGLPRTGTTLVERIIGSHAAVFAAGELQHFSIELVKLAQHSFPQQIRARAELIAKTPALDYQQLGENYLTSTRPRTGNTARFIDKLPLNFLYAGLIHKAMPNAKIIHLTRKPMDACYAIYKTLFEQAYPYSYDLQDLAHYYVAYRQLMSHWQNLLGDHLINVSYEELVADQEGVSRQLLQSCGLEWQQACLKFQDNKTPTATASSTQVREGIYSRSVDKWRCYEEQLSVLKTILLNADIDFEKF